MSGKTKYRLTGAGCERAWRGYRSCERGGGQRRERGRTVGWERPGGGEEQLDTVVLEDVAGQRCQTPGCRQRDRTAGGQTESQTDTGGGAEKDNLIINCCMLLWVWMKRLHNTCSVIMNVHWRISFVQINAHQHINNQTREWEDCFICSVDAD